MDYINSGPGPSRSRVSPQGRAPVVPQRRDARRDAAPYRNPHLIGGPSPTVNQQQASSGDPQSARPFPANDDALITYTPHMILDLAAPVPHVQNVIGCANAALRLKKDDGAFMSFTADGHVCARSQVILHDEHGKANKKVPRETRIPKVYPRLAQIYRTQITWGDAITDDRLHEGNAPVMKNRPNMIMGFLAADLAIDRIISTQFTAFDDIVYVAARELDNGLAIYNNSGFYALGFLYADALATAEQMNMAPAAGAHDNTGIRHLNCAPQTFDELHTAAQILQMAIREGYFHLPAALLDPANMSFMRLMAQGAGYLQWPADHKYVPLLNSFDLPHVEFMTYGSEEIPEFPAPIPLTSALVLSCLRQFAQHHHDKASMVRGFNMASMICNGRLHFEEAVHGGGGCPAAAGGGHWRYFQATFETGACQLPRPVATNFLWSLIDLRGTAKQSPDFDAEHHLLCTQSAARLQLIGTLISAVYSLGVSALFHYYNIVGRELNIWAGLPGCRDGAHQLQDYLDDVHNANVIGLRSVAQVFALQCTRFVFDPSSFCGAGSCFGAGPNRFDGLAADTLWSGPWRYRVPYIWDPFALCPVLRGFCNLWGYMGSPGAQCIVRAVVLSSRHGDDDDDDDDADYDAIDVAKADARYKEAARSATGNVYIDFGVLFLNALRQRTRNTAVWPIEYGGYTNPLPIIDAEPDFVPVIDRALYGYEIGTLLSYSYRRDMVLAACIRADALPPDVWRCVRLAGYHGVKYRAGMTMVVSAAAP